MPERFERVHCSHDEVELEGFLGKPERAGPHPAVLPAVLMFPGATGPGPSFEAAARELVGAGYVVAGIDMYGRGADLSTPQSAGRHFADLLARPDLLRARVLAWLDVVCALPSVDAERVAAVGYCFGGKCVLELARSGAAVKAVSSFHGLLGTHAPAMPGAVRARIAVWTGGRDPYVPRADLAALRAELDTADADYQMTEFARARHAFTDPDHDGIAEGIAYDPVAHRIAWSGTLALLEASLAA